MSRQSNLTNLLTGKTMRGLNGPFYDEAIPPAGFYGIGDVPSDYGVPYAGHVHQPYAPTGPMGSLAGLTETLAAIPAPVKIAAVVWAVYAGLRYLR